MFIGNRQKEAIYFNIFSGLSLWRRSNSEKLTRFKIAADTFITFAGEFFYRWKRRHRVAIMYVVQIEVSFVSTGRDSDKPEKVNISILSGCFRLWTLCNHILGDQIETSSNLFSLLFPGVWVFGITKTQTSKTQTPRFCLKTYWHFFWKRFTL